MSVREADIALTQAAVQQEADDALICAFGPDFFSGARTASGFGCAFSYMFAFRLYRSTKRAVEIAEFQTAPSVMQRRRLSFWNVLRLGARCQPLLALGTFACSLTGFAKGIKWLLASHRTNEFFVDELEFKEISHWANHSPETAAAFRAFCKEQMEQEAGSGHAAAKAPLDLSTPTPTQQQKRAPSVVSQLIRDHERKMVERGMGDRMARRAPTYWDGVAVGLFGSIMDCYLPTKPVSAYYDMKFGVL